MRREWQSAAAKLVRAAENGALADIEAATKQMELALLLDVGIRPHEERPSGHARASRPGRTPALCEKLQAIGSSADGVSHSQANGLAVRTQ